MAAQQMLGWVASIIALMAVMHLGLIAQVRGSAVRLGPDQFPELHAHVEQLARRMGLRRTPEVYLMQQDGAINAFATRFLRTTSSSCFRICSRRAATTTPRAT